MKRTVNWRKVCLGWALALLLLLGVVGPNPALAAEASLGGLVGMYDNGAERLLVRERDGQLELVFDTNESSETWFAGYAAYPLRTGQTTDAYRLLAVSPLRREIAAVSFERDAAGRGRQLRIGDRTYRRHFFDVEEGRVFRIQPLLPTEQLRRRALAAVPPVETGEFWQPDLVEVTKLDPTIRLDVRYAATNNFMGIQLYDEARAFLQRPAAEAVARVHAQLRRHGYGLILYDAYRPWYVTKMFWDATPDQQKVFVADPSKGSRHNRGGAVDISLYSLETGAAVDMGSDYDEFSIRAYPTYPGGTSAQRERRELLRLLMAGEGFTIYPEEWWHFDYTGWRHYPILNLRFSEL